MNQPLVGRDAGINCAANRFGRSVFHSEVLFGFLSRRPKNLGPFQRAPVIAQAGSGGDSPGASMAAKLALDLGERPVDRLATLAAGTRLSKRIAPLLASKRFSTFGHCPAPKENLVFQ